jgi:hypothetical protein
VKRVIGSIPIIAVLVLLFGVVFNIVEQPQTALAVSPVIKVFVANPVPGADNSTDQNNVTGANHVQTDWAHEGTVLLVRVESGGIVGANGLDSQLTVAIETDDHDTLAATVVTERIFDLATAPTPTDDGFIQFEILILNSLSASSTVGSGDFIGAANRFQTSPTKTMSLRSP